MIRRLLRRVFRRGGTMPAYRPAPDEKVVTLSPGWVELPPGAEACFPPEVIDRMNRINQSNARPGA